MDVPALRSVIPAALLAVLTLTGAGCGGGGGGGSTPAPAPAPPTSNDPPLVAGSETALISAVLSTASDAPLPAQEVSHGFLLSRLLVGFKSSATVGQVNAAARAVGATRITSSEPGSLLVVVQVPRQASVAAIQSLARTMRAQTGVAFAWPGQTAKTSVLPEFTPGVPVATISLTHLLANRFPQAWNARQAIAADCLPHSVNVYVMDAFGDPATRPDFFQQVERSSFIADPTSPADGSGGHGYDVVSALIGKFDANAPTGANPFADCVLVHARDGIDGEYLDIVRRALHAVAADGEARVILTSSINFPDDGFCGASLDQPCDATSVAAVSRDVMQAVLEAHAAAAGEWARLTRTLGLQEKVLVTQAAGNIDEEPAGFLARNYLGFRLAELSSPAALATHMHELRALLTDSSLWKSASNPTLPDYTFSASDADAIVAQPLFAPDNSISAANLLIVDSGTSGEAPADVHQSAFDMLGADVRAVGEDVVVGDEVETGTSFSAPLAAGLASYLWNLSPALLARPPSATADLLKQSSLHGSSGATVPVLDAYAAVLQLDDVPGCCTGASLVPIRLGLLDVNGDGVFDALDVQKFVDAYGLDDPNTPTIPSARDYSRFDLNGDGLTGGIPIASFDLDVNGLDASGQALINSTDATIEGYPLSFNEAALSDLQILCYYAYSPLYVLDAAGQNQQARTDLLGPDHCVGARLTVSLPAQIAGPTTVDVLVEIPSQNGQLAPAPNVHLDLAPTCASVNPTSGQTNANGRLSATVTPGAGCLQLSLDVSARAAASSPTLAVRRVTATTTPGSFAGTVTVTFSGSDTLCNPNVPCITETMNNTQVYELQVAPVGSTLTLIGGSARVTVHDVSPRVLFGGPGQPNTLCGRTFDFLNIPGALQTNNDILHVPVSATFSGGPGEALSCNGTADPPPMLLGSGTIPVLPQVELVGGAQNALVWDGTITVLDPLAPSGNPGQSIVGSDTRRLTGTLTVTGRLERR